MAFTTHCDVFGSFHEDGFNRILVHVMRQRPSLFNYATAELSRKEEQLCERINVHPAVDEFSNPHTTVVPLMPILGYNGPYGLEYCFQISDVKIDFFPSNVLSLPTQLTPPLKNQQAAFYAKVCAGIGCPIQQVLERLATAEVHGQERPQPPTIPIPYEKLQCFCLELFAIVEVVRDFQSIRLVLRGLEIVDITPEGLENSMECYMKSMLQLSLFPKIKIALNDLVFNLGGFISIGPSPINVNIPFNPSIDNDKLSIFLKLS